MKKYEYTPSPIRTDGVRIPDDLGPLVEELARNVHETWAAGRLKEGWTFGPERNDVLRQTPCLVPYEELPEEEKAYDRNTALSTIRLILASGYEIRKINWE